MIISRNAQETFELGKEFASVVGPGDVLVLCGDLGAGKTHLVKGLAAGLGVSTEVTSPTFTLIHEYPGSHLTLYHIDLYRLEDSAEALGIGLEEYMDSDGVTVIEWGDKFPELMPKESKWIRLRVLEGDLREINFEHP